MAIFTSPIPFPIGAEDMEFYESDIVLKMALLLSGYSEGIHWDTVLRTNGLIKQSMPLAACLTIQISWNGYHY